MADGKRNKDRKTGYRAAPGYSDEKFGEDASKEEIKKGESTRVTRVFLDENDPS